MNKYILFEWHFFAIWVYVTDRFGLCYCICISVWQWSNWVFNEKKNVKPKFAFIVHKALMTKLEIVLFYSISIHDSHRLLMQQKAVGFFCMKTNGLWQFLLENMHKFCMKKLKVVSLFLSIWRNHWFVIHSSRSKNKFERKKRDHIE